MRAYDPNVIQKFADNLYARAMSVIVATVVLGAAAGYLSGITVATAAREDRTGIGLFFAVLGSLFGFAVGSIRADAMRLSAQIALCQKQIEMNTRRQNDR